MKGSFSGGRVLTGSFISDQCLWGALVDLQGAGVSAFSPCLSPSFSRCLVHSPCMPGWPVSWAHPPDPAERTITHYETEGTEYATKKKFTVLPFLHSQASSHVFLCEKVIAV